MFQSKSNFSTVEPDVYNMICNQTYTREMG